ncbi:MAG: sigma-E factor negative regulatory protein [Porticoccaceae bacterium]|nr:sigma-E factor negative regulatory protein [Porticoccaceae bacterium]
MSESNKRLTESVSALVDGEVSELELHRILKQLELDGSTDQAGQNEHGVASKWSRYNLMSHAMSNTPLDGKDISQSVSNAIAQEETYKTNFIQNIVRAKSVGRFAIAASVAFMAIVGVQQLNNISPLQDNGFQTAGSANEAKQLQRPANQFPSGFQPMIEARTVNAGGVVKTSQHAPKLIKLYSTSNDALTNQLGLKAEYVEDQATSTSKNAAEDLLPVDLDANSTVD